MASYNPECRESLLLPASSDDSGSYPLPPLGSETQLSQEQSSAGLPSGPCSCQRPPYVAHLSALEEQTGALGVLCCLIPRCQTTLSPQKHSVTPRDPSVTAHLQEPSLSGIFPTPALTPAPHRTSLTDGKGGGSVGARHGGKGAAG